MSLSAQAADAEDDDAVSFAFPLATVPAASFVPVGTPAPASCPGSHTHPEAAPGHLCVYEANSINQNYFLSGLFDPATSNLGSGLYGFAVQVFSNGPGTTFSIGTWAVTAP